MHGLRVSPDARQRTGLTRRHCSILFTEGRQQKVTIVTDGDERKDEKSENTTAQTPTQENRPTLLPPFIFESVLCVKLRKYRRHMTTMHNFCLFIR
jgi:hypothetical protein